MIFDCRKKENHFLCVPSEISAGERTSIIKSQMKGKQYLLKSPNSLSEYLNYKLGVNSCLIIEQIDVNRPILNVNLKMVL